MTRYLRSLTACILGLPLLLSVASAQTRQISTTADNQILLELAPDDLVPGNAFDLNERTVVFTPDGHGDYSRTIQPVHWEDDIGESVADGTEIQLESFMLDFAGQRWGSFFVSSAGLITFGEPFEHDGGRFRFLTMHEIAARMVAAPTISTLYKPYYAGEQYVLRQPDRVVVTWATSEPHFHIKGIPPAQPARFQVVLRADGSVRFNYREVPFGDGIVGLFPNEGLKKGLLLAGIADPTRSDLPGYLDLLDVAVYEANTDGLIIEWTLREAVATPPSGTTYSYRLYADLEEPYFDGDDDFEFMWSIEVTADDISTRRGRRLSTDAPDRIALLADIGDVFGATVGIKPDAAQFDDGQFVQGNWRSRDARITVPDALPQIDLSVSAGAAGRQREVFHYPRLPDLVTLSCGVIDALARIMHDVPDSASGRR